ncbi:MAG: hypothetical protein KAS32_10535 [Candidatus Peribacteraceae bacterium]|nr:hypothetical protein [Candidatus Peribacteraceae bacterium]
MELIAKASGGGNRPLPEAGMQQGVLYSVIDLGTQEVEYMGKLKYQRKLNVAWELPNLPKLDYEDDNGNKVMRPSCVFKSYTLSLFEKANLAKDLSGWRGQKFTKEEENGFNVFAMLKPGANALLNIIHYNGKDGQTRAIYEGVGKLMQGMPELAPENPIVQYSTEMGDKFAEGMPEWAIETIKKSPEYRAVMDGNPIRTTLNMNEQAATDEQASAAMSYPDDDIPF